MREERAYRKMGTVVALCGGGVILAGLFLPWVSAGVDADHPSRGVDLVAAYAPAILSVLVSTSCVLVWWRTGREEFATYAALAAGFLALLVGAMLLAIEASGGLIPVSFVPETLRRSAGVLSAGSGLWTCLAGAAVVIAVTSGLGKWQFRRHSWSRSEDRMKAGIAALLLALTVLVGWLRYQPWVGSSALGRSLSLSGQAAPWVGPASLFALGLLVGAFVLLAFSRFQAAGLVFAGAGWLVSFLAAVSVIAGESLARLRLDDLLEGAIAEQGVTFQAAAAAWGTYVCGIVIAAVGGFLVCWRPYQSGGD